MDTKNVNTVNIDVANLTEEQLKTIAGGFWFFGLEIDIDKEGVTVCGPDKCVRITSKSTTTF
jgi:hypothetical protein